MMGHRRHHHHGGRHFPGYVGPVVYLDAPYVLTDLNGDDESECKEHGGVWVRSPKTGQMVCRPKPKKKGLFGLGVANTGDLEAAYASLTAEESALLDTARKQREFAQAVYAGQPGQYLQVLRGAHTKKEINTEGRVVWKAGYTPWYKTNAGIAAIAIGAAAILALGFRGR